MATRIWSGRAQPVAQVRTHTPASVSVGSTFTVTINQRTVTYTATTTVVADVTAGLVALLQACEFPEFQEVTWTDSTTTITSTGPDTGKPVTITTAAGGAGAPTFLSATTTSASGPNWWSVATNWEEGSVPANTNDVIIGRGPSILYGLDQSSVALNSLTILPTYDGDIGLPKNSDPQNPDNGYPQYLDTRLKLDGCPTCTIESASRRIRIDFGTSAAAITVNGTGQPETTSERALDIIGVNASNTLKINAGNVGVAISAGEVSTFSEIDAAYRSNPSGDVSLIIGSGVTLTTLLQSGGDITLKCAVTTLTKTGGTLTRIGSGAITTLRNRAGAVNDDGTGTITTLHNTGTYTRRGLAALTITTMYLYRGAVADDPNGTITWTNPVQFYECHPAGPPGNPGPAPAWFSFGTHRKITPTSI